MTLLSSAPRWAPLFCKFYVSIKALFRNNFNYMPQIKSHLIFRAHDILFVILPLNRFLIE